MPNRAGPKGRTGPTAGELFRVAYVTKGSRYAVRLDGAKGQRVSSDLAYRNACRLQHVVVAVLSFLFDERLKVASYLIRQHRLSALRVPGEKGDDRRSCCASWYTPGIWRSAAINAHYRSLVLDSQAACRSATHVGYERSQVSRASLQSAGARRTTDPRQAYDAVRAQPSARLAAQGTRRNMKGILLSQSQTQPTESKQGTSPSSW